jgi:hypothetical protein
MSRAFRQVRLDELTAKPLQFLRGQSVKAESKELKLEIPAQTAEPKSEEPKLDIPAQAESE